MARSTETKLFSDIFVGRRGECNQADALLAEVCGGRGGALILEGEPGIGKSRLMSEVSRAAGTRGMTVLLGRCHQIEDREVIPPYWPWIEILRAYEENRESRNGETTLGGLLPEPESRAASFTPVSDLAYRSFLLHDAVIRLLKTAAEGEPLLLVLEDIHNADQASLKLLSTLSQSIETERIALFVTYRSAQLTAESRLAESVGEIAKLRNYRHIHLQGISVDEVGEFIRAAAGSDVSDRTVSAVYDRTDGNCLYVRELVRAFIEDIGFDRPELEETDALIRRHAGTLVPLIAGSLRMLPEKTKRLLEIAALIGKAFSLEQLSAVLGPDAPEDLDAALEPACQSVFIKNSPQGADWYSFVHAVFQDALIAVLGSAVAARTRGAIGLALEEYYQKSADDHAGELARFLADGETERERERCFHYSYIAGEQALSTYGMDEMAEHFLRALDLKRFRCAEEELARIYYGLSIAYEVLGRFPESARMLGEACESYFNAGETAKALNLILDRPTLNFVGMGAATPRSTLELALSQVAPDSPEAAGVMASIAVSEHFSGGHWEQTISWLNKSLEIARRLGDPASRIIALEAKGTVLESLHRAGWEEYRGITLEMIDLDAENPASPILLDRRLELAVRAIRIGKVRDARRIALRVLSEARDAELPSSICRALHLVMISHQLEGEWEEARRCSDEALAMEQVSHSDWHGWILGARSILEYQAGRIGQGEAYAEAMRKAIRDFRVDVADRLKRFGITDPDGWMYAVEPIGLNSTVALITGIYEDLDQIREACRERVTIVRQKMGTGQECVYPGYYWDCCAFVGLAAEAILQSDLELARECYKELENHPSTMLYPGSWFAGVKGRLLGLLNLTLGDADAAVDYFEECYRFCGEEELTPMLAWVCYDYARALLLRSAEGDRSKAEQLLREGLSIASKLGMKPVETNITGLLAKQFRAKPSYPDGLTVREVEVLSHVARGKTNQEIGRDLRISVNTVANHIKHIFAKTATTNRVAASTYGRRAGLVPEEPTESQ